MAVGNKWMIDPNNAVMLLIAHQSGLTGFTRPRSTSVVGASRAPELPVRRSEGRRW